MYRKSRRTLKLEAKRNRCETMRAAKERRRLERCADEPIREALPIVALRVTIQTPHIPQEIYELRRKDDYARRLHCFCNDQRLSGTWSNTKLFRSLEKRRYV